MPPVLYLCAAAVAGTAAASAVRTTGTDCEAAVANFVGDKVYIDLTELCQRAFQIGINIGNNPV